MVLSATACHSRQRSCTESSDKNPRRFPSVRSLEHSISSSSIRNQILTHLISHRQKIFAHPDLSFSVPLKVTSNHHQKTLRCVLLSPFCLSLSLAQEGCTCSAPRCSMTSPSMTSQSQSLSLARLTLGRGVRSGLRVSGWFSVCFKRNAKTTATTSAFRREDEDENERAIMIYVLAGLLFWF